MRSNLAGVLAIVLASGCSAPRDPYEHGDGATTPVLRRTAHLAEAPLIQLEPMWFITSGSWAEPTRISIGTEYIAVLDPTVNQVHLVRIADGSVLPSIGRTGKGPGEWTGLRAAVVSGDQLVVSLSSRTSLLVHDLAGLLVKTIELDHPALQLMQDQPGFVVTRPATGAQVFNRIDLSAGSLVAQRDAGQTSYSAEQYGDCSQYTVVAGGIIRLRCTAGRFERVNDSGTVSRWLEWPDETVAATEAELDRYVERFWTLRSGGRPINPIVQRQLANLRERAALKPKYPLLDADHTTGRLLVLEQPFGEYAAEAGVLHLLSPDGRHLGRIEPGRVIQDAAHVGDALVLLVRDLTTDELGLGMWRMKLEQ